MSGVVRFAGTIAVGRGPSVVGASMDGGLWSQASLSLLPGSLWAWVPLWPGGWSHMHHFA